MVVKCPKSISFEECELAILRSAVDKIDYKKNTNKLQNKTIQNIISIVEDFIRNKKCVCYGGTAINNILPIHDQFYDKNIEFPDYDFYSPNALEHAKQLADEYVKQGFEEVEAKAGLHIGTYKVFVDFLPVADITQIHITLFKTIQKYSLNIENILYCPPNFLRMSMYLELSRPKGDVSRWEKVLKRITLLNKHYPLKTNKCKERNIQRIFENQNYPSNDIYQLVCEICIQEKAVFFGAMAFSMYTKYMSEKKIKNIPDFDVLSENPLHTIEIMKLKLKENGIKHVRVYKHKNVGEIISTHYELKIGKDTVAFIYEPLSCHSYNIISVKKQKIRIATIDTMLSFYLAFAFSSRPYFDLDRILCMCEFLFKVQQKNRLSQKGLLRRFSMKCIGEQKTMEDIRSNKSELFNKLKVDRNSSEFKRLFLKYAPFEEQNTTTNKTKKKKQNTKKTIKKKKTKKETNLIDSMLSWFS